MNYKNWSTKVIVIVVIISTMAPSIVFATGLPTIDGANLGQNIMKYVKDIAQWVQGEAFKVLRDVAVKQIVDGMTNDIIDSIEGGGQPRFIQNYSEFLNESGDIAFNSVNESLKSTGLDLCAPFRPQLSLYLETTYRNRNTNVLKCRFEDFKENIKNTENFITEGGWVTYDQMFVPSNNYFGQTLLLDLAYQGKLASEKESRQAEIAASKGFTGVRKCIDPADWKEGATKIEPEWDDEKMTYVEKEVQVECKKWETVTPGSIVAESATEGILKDFAYAENVQSIISALVNTAIKKVFNEAKGLVFGKSTTPGGSTYSYSGGADQVKEQKETLSDLKDKYESVRIYFGELAVMATKELGLVDQARSWCYANAKSYDIKNFPDSFGGVVYKDESDMKAEVYLGVNTTNGKDPLKDYFSKIITETTKGIDEIRVNVSEINSVLNSASSTDTSDLIVKSGKVQSAYSKFNEKYTYARDVLIAEGSVGPGTSSFRKPPTGLVLQNLYSALSLPDYGVASPAIHDGGLFFYCGKR